MHFRGVKCARTLKTQQTWLQLGLCCRPEVASFLQLISSSKHHPQMYIQTGGGVWFLDIACHSITV